MRLKPFNLLLIILFIPLSVIAQPVLIKGWAKAYKGSTVTLFTYKDYITHIPLQLGSASVNAQGRFILRVKGVHPCTYAYLSIENLKASIYLEPGKEYHVAFPLPDTLHYHNPLVTHTVDLSFLIYDTSDMNNLMIDFNDRFDAFWTNHYQYFVRKEANPYLDSFKVAMQNRYAPIQNRCFKESYPYAFADIAFNIMEGRKTLTSEYLWGKQVLFDNNEYMQFFNEFFDGYMENLTATKEGAALYKYIDSPDYGKLMDILKGNPLLAVNDTLRELVLLKGLQEFYYSGDESVSNIKTLLSFIANHSRYFNNRVIANDILDEIAQASGGSTAPDFALKDAKGNITSILDFRGKYLYLWFFRTTESAAQRQMAIVPLLVKKYKRKVNFVAISEDKNYSALIDFLKENKSFNWTFLFDEGQKVLKEYGIKVMPEYLLINPKGRIVLYPADDPSHGIQNVFEEILHHNSNKRLINNR